MHGDKPKIPPKPIKLLPLPKNLTAEETHSLLKLHKTDQNIYPTSNSATVNQEIDNALQLLLDILANNETSSNGMTPENNLEPETKYYFVAGELDTEILDPTAFEKSILDFDTHELVPTPEIKSSTIKSNHNINSYNLNEKSMTTSTFLNESNNEHSIIDNIACDKPKDIITCVSQVEETSTDIAQAVLETTDLTP